MSWTDEQRKQFKNLLKTIPSEDVAIVTAYAWCKELELKFDGNDEHIARRWHRYFHLGSLEAASGKLHLYVKSSYGNWLPVKQMSTKAKSIWTCLDRSSSFLCFDSSNDRCQKMAKFYVDAARNANIEVKVVEA